ncbi:hypothetical protein Y032_0084g1728 [Ancylostoma ceylanicum]|uniref:Uncharacterized protein n=1 Tax=Ancylostoma ceylanicum TaxID=53326 RepID=A0A016TQV6_9BILA|nr:hypothetical protein Y032_0084g1728 [Ancylostoma ceylanicum]
MSVTVSCSTVTVTVIRVPLIDFCQMSIDAEITRINEGIAKVHTALYKFNNQLDGILKNINGKLNDFDAGVSALSHLFP